MNEGNTKSVGHLGKVINIGLRNKSFELLTALSLR